jgi:hypothetical protein
MELESIESIDFKRFHNLEVKLYSGETETVV